jgi:hypothetical protein
MRTVKGTRDRPVSRSIEPTEKDTRYILLSSRKCRRLIPDSPDGVLDWHGAAPSWLVEQQLKNLLDAFMLTLGIPEGCDVGSCKPLIDGLASRLNCGATEERIVMR